MGESRYGIRGRGSEQKAKHQGETIGGKGRWDMRWAATAYKSSGREGGWSNGEVEIAEYGKKYEIEKNDQ